MSLLLDALKKSGDSQHKGTGLTLEEATPARAASASPAPESPARAAGETLFAAKRKKAARRRWTLGLVPTTFLICSILGAGYGYYVWLQLQPPSQAPVAQRTAPPPPAPVAAPVSVAAIPLVPAPAESAAPPEPQPAVAMRSDDSGMPHKTPKTRRPRSQPATAGIAVQRKVEADSITPALLDAWQAYQRGDYVTAAQGYRQVLSKDAHNRDALLGLAATAQQQGQDEAAQRYFREMLVLDPRDPDAQAALSVYMTGDAGNSESRLRQLLAEQPRSGTLHFALGNLYAEQSNWADAQQYYFNAYTLEPSNAQFAFNLAVSLDHLGQRKLAAQHYQLALQLDVSGNSGFDHAQAQQRLNELTTAR